MFTLRPCPPRASSLGRLSDASSAKINADRMQKVGHSFAVLTRTVGQKWCIVWCIHARPHSAGLPASVSLALVIFMHFWDSPPRRSWIYVRSLLIVMYQVLCCVSLRMYVVVVACVVACCGVFVVDDVISAVIVDDDVCVVVVVFVFSNKDYAQQQQQE